MPAFHLQTKWCVLLFEVPCTFGAVGASARTFRIYFRRLQPPLWPQYTENQQAESGAGMLPALLFASSSKEKGAQRLDAVARHRHCAQRKRHGSPSGAALQRNQHAGQGNRASKGRLLATVPHPNLARRVKSICCSIKPFYGREKKNVTFMFWINRDLLEL